MAVSQNLWCIVTCKTSQSPTAPCSASRPQCKPVTGQTQVPKFQSRLHVSTPRGDLSVPIRNGSLNMKEHRSSVWTNLSQEGHVERATSGAPKPEEASADQIYIQQVNKMPLLIKTSSKWLLASGQAWTSALGWTLMASIRLLRTSHTLGSSSPSPSGVLL